MSDLDLSQPIRDGLLAEPLVVDQLPAYKTNGKTIFTRRPVPSDAPYPMIVISPDVSLSDSYEGIDHERQVVVRDIAVYGRNEPASSYRQVEEIAYAVRDLFHRKRHSLIMDGDYSLIDVRASGPRPAPTDDQQTVGRVVELTVRLSKGPMPYAAHAVHINASAYLDIASLAATDNGMFSASFWFKYASDLAENAILFITDYSGNYTSYLMFRNDFLGTWVMSLSTVWSATPPLAGVLRWGELGDISGAWHHLLLSAETNFVMGSRKYKCYVDDVDVTLVVEEGGNEFIPLFNAFPFRLFDDDAGSKFVGDVADVWIAPGVSLFSGGDIPVETRRRFISDVGKPVDPSGFPPSAILFTGDTAGFSINQGTGGAFTLTGTLTNATSGP